MLTALCVGACQTSQQQGDGAAATGATIKDLMRRLGHDSPAASCSYLYTVDGRDAEIASDLSDLAAHGDAAKLPRSIVVKH